MTWKVSWDKYAEDTLTNLWMASSNRQEVSNAADEAD